MRITAWAPFLGAAFIATGAAAGGRSIGWWWHPPANASDPAVSAMLAWSAAHTDIVSTVMLHCGVLTCCRTGCGECALPRNASACAARRGTCENNNGTGGTVAGALTPSCLRAIPALNRLGIRTELWLGEDDSLSSARYLFGVVGGGGTAPPPAAAERANATAVALLRVAEDVARLSGGGVVSGFNIDLEASGGTAADAAASAAFLGAMTRLLGADGGRGLRFSADVSCNPRRTSIASDCAALSAAGRILNMDTYNAASYADWYWGKMAPMLAEVPAAMRARGALGVGLACYNDSKNRGTWAVTRAAAEQRVCALMNESSIVEIDMFDIQQGKTDAHEDWPPAFWYFRAGTACCALPAAARCLLPADCRSHHLCRRHHHHHCAMQLTAPFPPSSSRACNAQG
jgi:hypothetical protein